MSHGASDNSRNEDAVSVDGGGSIEDTPPRPTFLQGKYQPQDQRQEEQKCCYKCGGKGHYQRRCPTKDKDSRIRCHGCDGVGHIRRVCPTHKDRVRRARQKQKQTPSTKHQAPRTAKCSDDWAAHGPVISW